MPLQSVPISLAERERLDNCVLEPIRRAGSIQAHGMMLTANPSTWVIYQVSENSAAFVGRSAQDLIGTSLAGVIGQTVVDQLSAVLAGGIETANPLSIELNGSPLDVTIHVADDVAVVELESALSSENFSSTPAVYAAMRRLGEFTTREQLWEGAAREMHQLTGFDRVMVYHFHPDGHGQVVAEQRSDDSMEPYLGLHYPASDIPAQARDLYLTKASRTISSTEDKSFPLHPIKNPMTGQPLDLSAAELRSVSPHHTQFMRNMGQAATLSFSLIVDGKLVGMITCAHRTPRRLPFRLRQTLEALCGQLSLLLGSMLKIRNLERANELLALRKKLVEQFSSSADPEHALLRGPVTLLDLVPASTAAVHHEGLTSLVGEGLHDASVGHFVQRLLAGGAQLPFATEALSSDHPHQAEILPGVSGALVVPFGPNGDYLAWFRPGLTETIEWLGNQSESNRNSTLSPRNSFSSWSESVSGAAEPWGILEGEAIDLGRDLNNVFLRRAESSLAQVALHDVLTGLPNRRLLLDRLEHALAGHARGGDTALLFIDIDTFKCFNDSLGHAGGDAVLVQVAKRFLSSARAGDTLARLGGDEFVLLCEGTGAQAAHNVAERLRASLRVPLTFDGHDVEVTASIGVAIAEPGDSPAELLRRADAEMYLAKRSGKNRAAE